MAETFLTDKTSPVVLVTLTQENSTYTASHTFTQIRSFLNNGKIVVLKCNNSFYYISSYTDSSTGSIYFMDLNGEEIEVTQSGVAFI